MSNVLYLPKPGRRPPQAAAEDRTFLIGFGIGLAECYRVAGDAAMIQYVMEGNGVTLAMLEDAGLEEYDLDELRKAMS